MEKLGSELKDVRGIMSQNINDVLQRGDKLNRAAEESRRLVEDSKLYRKSASCDLHPLRLLALECWLIYPLGCAAR